MKQFQAFKVNHSLLALMNLFLVYPIKYFCQFHRIQWLFENSFHNNIKMQFLNILILSLVMANSNTKYQNKLYTSYNILDK